MHDLPAVSVPNTPNRLIITVIIIIGGKKVKKKKNVGIYSLQYENERFKNICQCLSVTCNNINLHLSFEKSYFSPVQFDALLPTTL